ncbi:hypothetical protein BGZ49_000030 [Haplosporangium sp. Z 27]|nr:hypothetical protein BGZ49_000030 [Haplosporangium sp. Z 27]
MHSEKKRQSKKRGGAKALSRPIIDKPKLVDCDIKPEKDTKDDIQTKEFSSTCTNQYITIVSKRMRNLKKKLMRIEQHEATLESDPSVKEKMDPDQVEFIGHKLEFIAMLKEMEAVMDLFNQQSSKDIDNQAHLNPVLELENLQYQESSETSLQLVRLFCALQELENNKRFAEKEGASSLETLASFRSSLFELANATDVSENKNDEQILHTMAKKLSIASLERVSEGNSATCIINH